MNVHNDRTEKEGLPQLDPFRLLTLALFSGAAMSTFLLAPLPLLLAGWRLPEPWPKVTAVVGAAIAVLVLEAPTAWVAIAFSMALVFSDTVERQKPIWGALAVTVLTALVVALVVFVFQARLQGADPVPFWREMLHAALVEVKGSFEPGSGMDWDLLEIVLFQQAPFLLAGLVLVSSWISLGAAAHFGWLNPAHKISAGWMHDNLRLPLWLSGLCTSGFLISLVLPLPFYVAGAVRFGGCLLFLQGTLCLSDILRRRGVSHWGRTLVYGLSITFGFYALLALGVVSPWYFRAARLAGPGPSLEEKNL